MWRPERIRSGRPWDEWWTAAALPNTLGVDRSVAEKMPTTKTHYPYSTDYNDHFETPLQAYQDIAPFVIRSCVAAATSSSMGAQAKKHTASSVFTLYDPYYCQGRTETYLQQALALQEEDPTSSTTSTDKQKKSYRLIHRKRDFYQDIQNQQIPDHDLFITNPPYSDDHKIKCLEFAVHNQRSKHKTTNIDGASNTKIPFMILMPDYVAGKDYFRKATQNINMVFLRPKTRYQYDHPENTGKETSPFQSLWYCGNIPPEVWKDYPCSTATTSSLELFTSIEELQRRGVLATGNRKGARERKRQRRKQQENIMVEPSSSQQEFPRDDDSATGVSMPNIVDSVANGPRKKSKYRDSEGKRQRKRF